MTSEERAHSGENFEIEEEAVEHVEEEKASLKGDYGNAVLLVVLYLFQGVPSGICSAVPILLQNRGVSYKEQAIFTAAYYPFSLKILWAPIVDSLYIKRFGRRKTWIVPSQFLIAVSMLLASQHADEWLGNGLESPPKILILTLVFFTIRILTATQDISVDGLALCILKKRNIGHAATCEAIGVCAGWSIGYVVLLVLESSEFSNSYIFSYPRSEGGLITLGGFLKFWGIAYLISTLFIAIFKKENPETEEKLKLHPDYGIGKAYPTLWKILNLKPIIRFALFMLTVKVSFAACDSVTSLKLVEYGVPKDKIALLAIPLLPLQMILPMLISRFTAGKYPMDFYIKAYRVRLFVSALMVGYVFLTSKIVSGKSPSEIPVYYFVGLVVVYLLYHIPFRAMSVAETAFFARISDPLIGGTYMTLLNTIVNLGAKWSQTFFLWLVDVISWKQCIQESHLSNLSAAIASLSDNRCDSKEQKELCVKDGAGKCQTNIDGYYIEFAMNVVYGVIFYVIGKRLIEYLEKLPIDDWHVLSKNNDIAESEEKKSCLMSTLKRAAAAAARKNENIAEKIQQTMQNYEVIVLGCGIAGLGAGRLLKNAKVNFLLLEASDRIGGRIHTVDMKSLHNDSSIVRVEAGAQWIHGKNNELFQFANGLNMIRSELSEEGEGDYVHEDGTYVDEFFVKKVDFKIGQILGECVEMKDKRDFKFPSSLADYVERRFDEFVSTLKTSDEKKQARQLFDWHRKFQIIDNSCNHFSDISAKDWGNYSFNGESCQTHINVTNGMSAITDELHAELKDYIKLGKVVINVAWKEPNGMMVHCQDGSIYSASNLVCTFSLGVLKSQHRTLFSPLLPTAHREVIEAIGFGTINKIFLRFSEKWWNDEWKGLQLLWNEDLDDSSHWTKYISGFDVTYPAPEKTLIGWIGGNGAKEVERLTDVEIAENCMTILRKFLAPKTIPDPTHIYCSRWNSNKFVGGAYSYTSTSTDQIDNWERILSQPVVYETSNGNRNILLFAGEAAHEQYFSTVHGAFLSGVQQAESILNFRKKNSKL